MVAFRIEPGMEAERDFYDRLLRKLVVRQEQACFYVSANAQHLPARGPMADMALEDIRKIHRNFQWAHKSHRK